MDGNSRQLQRVLLDRSSVICGALTQDFHICSCQTYLIIFDMKEICLYLAYTNHKSQPQSYCQYYIISQLIGARNSLSSLSSPSHVCSYAVVFI